MEALGCEQGDCEMNLRFTVHGKPRPQGSMRAVTPRGGRFTKLVSDNKHTMPWRQEIAQTVLTLKNRPREPWTAPIGIVLDFYFIRPKSAKKRIGMTVKPDVDKLCRALFDSLKGVVWVDDAQVIDARIRKHYGAPERVDVLVGELL